MDIKIKMQTVLKGEKGCLSKEDIVKGLKKAVVEIVENGGGYYIDQRFLDKLIDKVATEFDSRIPKEYDYEFNRVVAGLMGATCYMPDTFEKLNNKPIENILGIATQVENSGHHSTFGHSFLTLEISGIPKALAMVLNNEKDYNTSEKSARYTKLKDIEPRQNALYSKWVDIFEREIKKLYPDGSNKFFDPEGKKARKLAQENARYMVSAFTNTNMVYSTNFRQLNYIAHWMEAQIAKPENNFYANLRDEMQEFVDWTKDMNLYSAKLTDGKNRNFSLFGDPILKKIYSSNYQGVYKMSIACLAQNQRHRTINSSIDNLRFVNDFGKIKDFYIPPIIRSNEELKNDYLRDIASVSEFLPQGTLLNVNEAGSFGDFILKTDERLCACAQKEIRDLTLMQAREYRDALSEEARTLEDKDLRKVAQKYADKLTKVASGARCKAGYTCKAPCGFLDGINLESEV